MCHHTQLIFVSLVEMGFCHVGQAGLELLTSGDPPSLAFQSVGLQALATTPGFKIKFNYFREIMSHYVALGVLELDTSETVA